MAVPMPFSDFHKNQLHVLQMHVENELRRLRTAKQELMDGYSEVAGNLIAEAIAGLTEAVSASNTGIHRGFRSFNPDVLKHTETK
ncbi:MAG: hypothetical protein ACREA9_00220 [Pyrinomonadaceae bacterium]